MGGRIASMVAEEAGVAGVVCLGYPFHPPGKPENGCARRTSRRSAHRCSSCRASGTRSGGGRRWRGTRSRSGIRVHWLADGDHGLKPRKASGRTEAENLAEAAREAARFVFEVAGG